GQRGDVGSGGGLQPADVLHRGRVRLVGGTRAGGYGCARGQRRRKDIGRRGRGPRSSPACGAGRDGARSDAAPSGMTPGTAPSPAPPARGGGGHGRRSRGSAPSPAYGGRPGWGPAPTRNCPAPRLELPPPRPSPARGGGGTGGGVGVPLLPPLTGEGRDGGRIRRGILRAIRPCGTGRTRRAVPRSPRRRRPR